MIAENDKLSTVLSRNIDLLPIVYRYGIKSEIRQKSIAEICHEKSIDLPFFISVLNTYNSRDYFPLADEISLASLIEFLTKTHTYHKEVTIPYLSELVITLKNESQDKRFVTLVEKYFNDYVHRLLLHIEFEETEIFPLAEKDNRNKPKLSISNIKDLFHQHQNVESEINDLLTVIIQHIPEQSNIRLIHEILHTLSHFEKEQADHERFEEKILVPRLLDLLKS